MIRNRKPTDHTGNPSVCDPKGSNLSGSPENIFLNHSRHDLATILDVRIDRMNGTHP